jgi:hypothetical protein
VLLEGLGKLKKKMHLIGIRSRDLPACNIVLQPTALPRAIAFFFIWFVRLLALRPLLAYYASLG